MLITGRKIHALNWTRNRLPIPRSKLAYEVSKKVEQYLNRMAVRSYRDVVNFMVVHERILEGYSGRIR